MFSEALAVKKETSGIGNNRKTLKLRFTDFIFLILNQAKAGRQAAPIGRVIMWNSGNLGKWI